MAEQRVERRLAAILAGDVAGYSRMMGADEEGTLARLNAHRREFLEPKVAEYRGRIVKRTGDGVLIEFGSAVDAVRYAVEVQRGMAERNASTPQEKRIELRIGIHIGEVIIGDIGFRGHTVFTALGDSVNVTARLQDLCKSLSCKVVVSEEVCRIAGLPDGVLASKQVEIRGHDGPMIVRTENDPTVLTSLLELHDDDSIGRDLRTKIG